MDRKKITAYLINCAPDEFLAYADQDDRGTVVVGPDGKKFRFTNDQLFEGEMKKREKDQVAAAAKPKPEPKPAPKTSAGAKGKQRAQTKRSTSGTKTKAKAKPKQSKNSPAL